ncbi:hypothetical protein LR48_Vigan10g261700 [Vigna angularis]|uniref:Uncharacterized protein n=1 Tax=Phaseolus angularis TaxID=3914 RepID=A0A0L9VNV0_PHAAN|nr:hypothetical protein LR48_Vigan10g261700 [Vigna angularis]
MWVGLTTRKTPLFRPPYSRHSGDTPAMLRRNSGGECKGPAQGGKQVGRSETQNAHLVRWAEGRRRRLRFVRQRRSYDDRESEPTGGVEDLRRPSTLSGGTPASNLSDLSCSNSLSPTLSGSLSRSQPPSECSRRFSLYNTQRPVNLCLGNQVYTFFDTVIDYRDTVSDYPRESWILYKKFITGTQSGEQWSPLLKETQRPVNLCLGNQVYTFFDTVIDYKDTVNDYPRENWNVYRKSNTGTQSGEQPWKMENGVHSLESAWQSESETPQQRTWRPQVETAMIIRVDVSRGRRAFGRVAGRRESGRCGSEDRTVRPFSQEPMAPRLPPPPPQTNEHDVPNNTRLLESVIEKLQEQNAVLMQQNASENVRPRGVHVAAGEHATSAVHMADKQCPTPTDERQLSHAQLSQSTVGTCVRRSGEQCVSQTERASAVVEDAWQQCSGRPSGVGCQRRSGVRRQSADVRWRDGVRWWCANVRWQVGILNLFPTSPACPSLYSISEKPKFSPPSLYTLTESNA